MNYHWNYNIDVLFITFNIITVLLSCFLIILQFITLIKETFVHGITVITQNNTLLHRLNQSYSVIAIIYFVV